MSAAAPVDAVRIIGHLAAQPRLLEGLWPERVDLVAQLEASMRPPAREPLPLETVLRAIARLPLGQRGDEPWTERPPWRALRQHGQ